MLKKTPLYLILSIMTLVALMTAPVAVHAVDSASNPFDDKDGKSVPSLERIDQIRSVCKNVQTTINQIHVNDALLRVNLGRQYEDYSAKLMTPFNSRVVSNKLDASKLIDKTSQYTENFTQFRNEYRKYDDTMTEIVNIDCTANTEKFYNLIIRAREERLKVGTRVQKLSSNIEDYKSSFVQFRKDLANEKQ